MRETEATPGRLPGILLTPGTATARRKRVSFGHDVGRNDGRERRGDFRIDKSGRRPGLFSDTRSQARAGTVQGPAARAGRTAAVDSKPTPATSAIASAAAAPVPETVPTREDAHSDDNWEEVDDNDSDNDNDNDNDWDPDVTVDLNEPHSQSGRFWKSQFQRYQEDAKAEMGKLLKYKQLAKSYAKMKDAEAVAMRAKLQEEKDKVAQMEARITDLAAQIARRRMKGSDRDYQGLISDLTRQTAMAVQYRNQVKELEAMMLQERHDPDDVFVEAKTAAEPGIGTASHHRRRSHHQVPASPRTHRTLVEAQQELRRARDQARLLHDVKDEVRRLKSALRAAEQRVVKSERERKMLAADLAASETAAEAAAAQVEDLVKRAKFAEDERRRREDELRLLQRKYDALKDSAKARVAEAEQVRRLKNQQIAELEEAAKQAAASAKPPTAAAAQLPTSLAALEEITRSRYESLSNKRSQERKHAPPKPPPARSAELDGLVLKADNLRFGVAPDGDLGQPQPKVQRHKSKYQHQHQHQHQHQQHEVHILEDESSRSEMPRARTAKPTAAQSALAARTADNGEATAHNNEEAVSAANLILRRRRAAEPLQPLRPLRPLGRHGRQPAAQTAVDDDKADPGAPADASRLSLSSDRAAAAVARMEKRRAERQRELARLRDKENMQPA